MGIWTFWKKEKKKPESRINSRLKKRQALEPTKNQYMVFCFHVAAIRYNMLLLNDF